MSNGVAEEAVRLYNASRKGMAHVRCHPALNDFRGERVSIHRAPEFIRPLRMR